MAAEIRTTMADNSTSTTLNSRDLPIAESFDAGKSRRRKLRRICAGIAATAILAAGIAWGHQWWTSGRYAESTDDAYLQADNVVISTRVAGFVQEVLITDNQEVRAGDVLIRIDDRAPHAQLDQANAAVALAQAGIAQVEARLRQQEPELARAKAQLASVQLQARFAASQLSRYQALGATGAESAEAIDQVRQTQDQAHLAVEQSQAALNAAELQTTALRAQIEQACAQLKQAEAQVSQVQVDLTATVIRVPVAGRVGNRTAQTGQYVPVGTRLMTIVPVGRVYLQANFKETQIGRMRAGQVARIQVDALHGEVFSGVVESFSPGTGAQFALIPPTNATGNFIKIVQRVPVRIRLAPADSTRLELIPGLSVDVSVDTNPRVTPLSATLRHAAGLAQAEEVR
jgi:membrane fusion protein (multidrug efflux system)